MSNVCCAMFNVLVKAPDNLLTNHQIFNGNNLVIRSFRQLVVLQVHRTSHNRHSTFDSFGFRQFFHSSYDRRRSYKLRDCRRSAKRKRDSAQPIEIDSRSHKRGYHNRMKPDSATEIVRELSSRGHEAYLVGGCARVMVIAIESA